MLVLLHNVIEWRFSCCYVVLATGPGTPQAVRVLIVKMGRFCSGPVQNISQ